MPRLEDYVVHCRYDSRDAAICGLGTTEVDLLVSKEEFLVRAGGVCRACASSMLWKVYEAGLLRKEGR